MALQKLNKFLRGRQLSAEALFKQIDKNSSGDIDAEELRLYLKSNN